MEVSEDDPRNTDYYAEISNFFVNLKREIHDLMTS